MSVDLLSIKELRFEIANSHGKLDLEIGWPINSTVDTDFNVDIRGDDIRHIFPKTALFEPKKAAYTIKAVGHKKDDLISVEHFDSDIGGLHISLTGELDEDLTDEDVDITLHAVSNDLSTLGSLNGKPLPALALKLKADINTSADRYSFHNVSGILGNSDISGIIEVSVDGTTPKIDLVAKSSYIDLQPFLRPAETGGEEVTDKKPQRLIPATPLPLETLSAADITLRLNIDELRYKNELFKNLDFETEVLAGNLRIPKFSFEGDQGKFESSLSVSPTGANSANIRFDLAIEDMVVEFLSGADGNMSRVPSYDVYFHATGEGSNLQEVAGSVNGTFYMGSEGGILEGVNLNVLDTFVLDEIFSLIMPKSDQNDVLNLTCAATALKITDGLVETDPAIAFVTDKITVVTKGTLDLKTENMNFNFNATPNNALKISAGELFNPYILVGGTLTSPEVGLDPAKALLHGGAAIGTAGISILAKGLLDRVGTTIPLCEKMLQQTQQKQP